MDFILRPQYPANILLVVADGSQKNGQMNLARVKIDLCGDEKLV